MSKKNILYYFESSGFGGMERILFETAQSLAKQKYEVIIILNMINDGKNWFDGIKLEGVSIFPVKIKSKYFLLNVLSLIKYFKKYCADIIHFHLGSPTSCQSAIIAAYLSFFITLSFKKRVKLVLTEHSDCIIRANTLLSLRKILKQITIHLVSHIICVSRHSYNNLTNEYFISKSKMSIIYNAINLNDKFTVKNNGTRNMSLQDMRDKIVFITSARLEELKGHLYLIDAINSVRDKIPDAVFLFLGEGSYRKEIESSITNLKLSSIVFMLGFKENIVDYLTCADVFILPSLSEGGLPLSVMEAGIMGLPTIASQCGAIDELIITDVNGLLVDVKNRDQFSDAILKLYNNEELRIKLGSAAKKYYLDHFSFEIMIKYICKLYSQYI